MIRTLSFAYDAAGRLTAASDAAATYGYQYDGLGRVIYQSQSIAGLSPLIEYNSAFDAAGNRTSLSAIIGGTADFQNTYQYDGLSRLTSIRQAGVSGGHAVAEKRVDFTYNAAGWLWARRETIMDLPFHRSLAPRAVGETTAKQSHSRSLGGNSSPASKRSGGTQPFTGVGWLAALVVWRLGVAAGWAI